MSIDYVFRDGDRATIRKKKHAHEDHMRQIFKQDGFRYDEAMSIGDWWLNLEIRNEQT